MSHPAAVLDLDLETMRRLGARVVDIVARHHATLREQRVHAPESRRAVAGIIRGTAPEQPGDPEALLSWLTDAVLRRSSREPHPGFLAYVPSCPTFPAIAGDWLATGFNPFAGVWPVAPGPNQLELLVMDWFRTWLGMPEGTSGLFTSGGSSATMTAVVAARHAALQGDDAAISRLVLYTSDQAHSSVARAAWIAGIPRDNVRSIGTDDGYRLRPDLLLQAVARDRAAGLRPFIVVANAGTTNTGAVDPLHEVGEFCRGEDLWYHVDAAYGGFATLVPGGGDLMRGLALADTVTLDPHKWLFVPFECGCLLARDPARLADAFRIYPEYLKDVESDGDEVNFADWGAQLTRYARVFKVWLGVSYFGMSAIRAGIQHGIDLARRVEQRVLAAADLELLSPAQLGIACFRVHPPGLDDPAALDQLNERVNAAINTGGRFFISSTRLRDAFALRICALGFRTTVEDVDELVEAVREAGCG